MKQQRIIKTAGIYLHTFPTDLQPRFDVVEIYAPHGIDTRSPKVRLLENAF